MNRERRATEVCLVRKEPPVLKETMVFLVHLVHSVPLDLQDYLVPLVLKEPRDHPDKLVLREKLEFQDPLALLGPRETSSTPSPCTRP